jgi:hypothetical protein
VLNTLDNAYKALSPVLSRFKQHVRQLLRLDPVNKFLNLKRPNGRSVYENAEEPRK